MKVEDRQTLGQHKNQYRVRFYRNREEDLPEVRPGTNVLSAIKDYFNEAGGKGSPGFRQSSFLADSIRNTPDSNSKKQGSLSNPNISSLDRSQSIGKINETKMKESAAVCEKIKTPNSIITVNAVSQKEMDDCESDMPRTLVKEKKPQIFRLARNRFYSSDYSVVQGPSSPFPKASPKNRSWCGDGVVKDKVSFANFFASKYKSSAVHDPTMQIPEIVKTVPKPNTTATEYVTKEDDDKFVIEDERSVNMRFSYVNKRLSVGSSEVTTSTDCSSTRGNQKLQRKVSEVVKGHLAFRLSEGQPAWKETSKLNRNDLNNESKNNSNSGRSKETTMTPSTDSYQALEIAQGLAQPIQSSVQSQTVMDTDNSDLSVLAENELINCITDYCSDAKSSWNEKSKKILKDGKKSKKEKNVPSEVLNVTYISARPSDNATDSRESQNDFRDQKQKKRPTEVEKLVLPSYVQVVNQNDGTSLRPKRTSAPPSNWWVVKPPDKNTTFEIEEELPQNAPKNNGKESTESIDASEFLRYRYASFDPEVRTSLHEIEQQFLKESSAKSSKTSTYGKRLKKRNNVESEKTAVPSKANRQKKTKATEKLRSAAKREKKSKTQQKTPDSDNAKMLPRQFFSPPAYDSATLSFTSGAVLKTRAVPHNRDIDAVVRNLASEESVNAGDPSPMAVVRDPDTNQDALAQCIFFANNVGRGCLPAMTMYFNNPYFRSGKCVLKPMEQEVRDLPVFDILIFYVVQGKIALKLHESSYCLESGDGFFIPPNNTFHIQNFGTEDAELFYTMLKPES